MIQLILLLTMAIRVIAYEQIYAINAGGKQDHTDSDGIHYEKKTAADTVKWSSTLDFDNVPESDKPIYQYVDYGAKIKYDLPIKSDGLYVLIAKFSYANYKNTNFEILNVSLNHDLPLLSNVDQFLQCGGFGKICDKYFYFCVSDQKLYYKDQSSLIQNKKIDIEIRQVKNSASIAGLVLLKGSLGEKRKLISSATREEMYFDPLKTHPKCLPPPITVSDTQNTMEGLFENYWKNYTTTCEVNKFLWENVLVANEKTQEAVKYLQKQQNETIEEHQENINRFTKNHLEFLEIWEQFESTIQSNISNLHATIESSFEMTQSEINRGLQKHQIERNNRLDKMEQQINKSVSANTIFMASSLRQIS
jgi:Malectin domain